MASQHRPGNHKPGVAQIKAPKWAKYKYSWQAQRDGAKVRILMRQIVRKLREATRKWRLRRRGWMRKPPESTCERDGCRARCSKNTLGGLGPIPLRISGM